MNTNRVFRTIDLFAGPGGLAEGFSTYGAGSAKFDVALSVEKDPGAFRTLRLRSFFRNLNGTGLDDYFRFANGELAEEELIKWHPKAWKRAESETAMLELGNSEHDRELDKRLDALLEDDTDNFVVIGGPPCQAYSLAGRSRNAGNAGYVAEQDQRHFLFREYIRILEKVRPQAFVMENVKGILSSSLSGDKIFELVVADLMNAAGKNSYELFSLSPDPDKAGYVLRAEEYGVPQTRHRVILLGLRTDVADCFSAASACLPKSDKFVTVGEALRDLPPLRSGLSRGEDSFELWKETVIEAFSIALTAAPEGSKLRSHLEDYKSEVLGRNDATRTSSEYTAKPYSDYAAGLRDPRLKRPPNHDTRGHMASDLARYAFCSAFASIEGRSPSFRDFPEALAPDHQSWRTGKFADRFKVQVETKPSSTITSHISKDGHYFIHPDPTQCRSLTVREAARLQSFPDDYIFLGNRTSQYVQVGNAVPPALARQIAGVLSNLLANSGARSQAA